MLSGFIYGLLVAWFLSLFGVDKMIITSVQEVFQMTISASTYYVVAGLFGLISALLHQRRNVCIVVPTEDKGE